jgi:hypothetical protein
LAFELIEENASARSKIAGIENDFLAVIIRKKYRLNKKRVKNSMIFISKQ